MANQTQPLEVLDFSGGMTDFYIGGPTNRSQLLENVYIAEDLKPTTRPALAVYNTAAARVTTNKRIQKMLETEDTRFEVSDGMIWLEASNAYSEIAGPTGNDALTAADENSLVSVTKWNRHAYLTDDDFSPVVRLFKDGSTWKAHQLGLPTPVVSGVTLTATTPGAGTYQVVLVAKVTYINQGVTFQERSAVSDIKSVTSASVSGVNTITVGSIPTLSNSTTFNYDTTNIKYEIYRTTDGGDVFYYSGEITNGTSSYVIDETDTDLQLNEELYITGGFLDHDAPPLAKYIESVNDVMFYGHVKEDGVVYPNKLRVSNRFQPWSCPIDFFEEFEEPIMGLSSINSSLLVYLETKTVRVDGFFLPDGNGGLQKKTIGPTDGTINAASLVKTPDGVFAASKTGFTITDGNSVMRVNDQLVRTYAAHSTTATQISHIVGEYDALNNRVLWAVQQSDTETEADSIFVAHLKFGIKKDMCFTVWTGGSVYPANLRPSALLYRDFQVFVGDARGYVLYFDDEMFSDIKVDTTSAAEDWTETAILYDIYSIAHDFGTSSYRKWIPWMIVHADNSTSVSLAISGSNDNAALFRDLDPIKLSGNIPWGSYDVLWGDEGIRWDYSPIISGKRRFPSGGLRCLYKQVRFTNMFALIESSENLGQATFNSGLNTVTLVDGAQRWPDDVIDYYVINPADETERYLIAERTSDTVLTCADLGALDGDLDWVIKGYRKGEVLKIISYIIDFKVIGQSFTPGRGGDE